MQCSISECKEKAIETVKISFRETRNLCQAHYRLFENKEKKYNPKFSKASDFLISKYFHKIEIVERFNIYHFQSTIWQSKKRVNLRKQ